MIRKIRKYTKPKLPNNIYIVGDINLQSYKLMLKIYQRKIKDSHIIVLGNFGIGVGDKSIESKNLSIINSKLKKNNNKLYLLRGNLDSKSLFKKYKSKYKNIILPEDYDIIKIENVSFLFVGGSETIDRSYYFYKNRKKPTMFRSMDIPNNIIDNIDVVLTHDSPSFIHPYNLYNLKPFTKTDKWLYNDVKKRRTKLTKVYEELKEKKHKINTWYCSKYSVSMVERKKSINFIQLNRMEITKLKL